MTRRLPRVARLAKRAGVPPPSLWHLVVPGVSGLVELRWAWKVSRAPTTTSAEHAVATADPQRRGSAIEEPIGCSLCGDQRMKPLLHPHDRKRAKPRWDYWVVRCAGCGFLYRHPGIRPDRLGELYEGGKYHGFLAGAYEKKRVRRYEYTMAGFGSLLASGDGRRLLDFGCGNGLFLDVAHARGFECHGVDLAPDAVAVARSKPSGANVHHGSPLDVPEISAGGFDVITMWSVLAHLAEPVEDLTMLRRLLAPDGVLLILTVNANSLGLKRQLDRWRGFTPNHLKFFAPDTLRLLLRRAGFAATVMPPWHGDPAEDGTPALGGVQRLWLRRTVDRGNRGNMLRAVAFASPDGPARWGLEGRPLAS